MTRFSNVAEFLNSELSLSRWIENFGKCNISKSWYILLYFHTLQIPLTVIRGKRRKEIKVFVFTNPC